MRNISRGTKGKFLSLFVVTALAALVCPPLVSADPILGPDLASFAVLGAATVTNVPTSTIVGNVGVSAGTALPGFNFVSGTATADSQVTGGSVHSNTATAAAAQAQLTTAITNFNSLGVGTLLAADLSLAGTILPGVYTVPYGITNLSGMVTLDGLGDDNAFWLFQMESSLITSPASAVSVINTSETAGVFWNVRSDATLDTTTSFQGNILALTSIWLRTNATIGCGSALAANGEVTLDSNTIGRPCTYGGLRGSGLEFDEETGAIVVSRVPEPSTLLLLGSGLLGLVALRKRSEKAHQA